MWIRKGRIYPRSGPPVLKATNGTPAPTSWQLVCRELQSVMEEDGILETEGMTELAQHVSLARISLETGGQGGPT